LVGSTYSASFSDYDAASRTITFAPGQTTASFAVADDALYEGTEYLGFTISSVVGAERDLSQVADRTLVLVDNDQPAGLVVRWIDPPMYSLVSESAGSVTFTLVLSQASTQPVTVNLVGSTYSASFSDYDGIAHNYFCAGTNHSQLRSCRVRRRSLRGY